MPEIRPNDWILNPDNGPAQGTLCQAVFRPQNGTSTLFPLFACECLV